MLATCTKLASRDAQWEQICSDAALLENPDDRTARAFFESRFMPRKMRAEGSGTEGLITGYYEPVLHGSLTKTKRFRFPIYRRPDDLLVIDLGSLYPVLRGRRVRGRLEGRRVVPYLSRAEITSGGRPLAGNEIVWVDDPVALFFLQIQGSGRVRLPNGETLHIGYADQNGHPYFAIGRRLVEMGALKIDEISLQSIRAWLEAHPDEAEDVFNSNPSYVFFRVRDSGLAGPSGSLDVPLEPKRSIAVDPDYIPLGSPVWLDTTLPDATMPKPFKRLVFAQDTGGAITGPARADLFLGEGAAAEAIAGQMKQPGRLYVLLPRARHIAVAGD